MNAHDLGRNNRQTHYICSPICITNISRMKGIFAFCMVFAALVCFAMPTDCKASVMPVDNDVGFVDQPRDFCDKITMSESMPLLESMAKDEITPPSENRKPRIYAHALIAHRWLYGDTKARTCMYSGGSCFVDGIDIKTIPKA